MSYIVAFKNVAGSNKNVITWTAFADEGAFETWFRDARQNGSDKPLSDVYKVVAKGISDKQAIELVQSPENKRAIIAAELRETAAHIEDSPETADASLESLYMRVELLHRL